MKAMEITLLVGVEKDVWGCDTKFGRMWHPTEAALYRALRFVFGRKASLIVVADKRLANVKG